MRLAPLGPYRGGWLPCRPAPPSLLAEAHLPNRVRIVLFCVVTAAMIVTWLAPTRSSPRTATPDQDAGLPRFIPADPPPSLAVQPGRWEPGSRREPLTIRTVDEFSRATISGVQIVDTEFDSSDDRSPSTQTDAEGEARVRAGDRRVVAVKSGYGPKALLLTHDMTGIHEVSLVPVRRLSGRVADASGVPVGGAVVRFIPSVGQLENLKARVDGFEGFFSEGMLTVGYEAISDTEGRFSIPIPETQSTLRIGTPTGRWIPELQDQREGRASPPDGVYKLRVLFKIDVSVKDAASGQEIRDPWISLDGPAGRVAADVPWESTEVEEAEEAEIGGRAGSFVRGFLVDATRTVVMLRVGAPGYQPRSIGVAVDSSHANGRYEETVELPPLDSRKMSRLRLRVTDSAERGDDPKFVGVLQADDADVADVGARVIAFRKADGYASEVSVPAGRYTLSAATPSQGMTTYEGRRTVAVVRSISPRSIVLPAGQLVDELIVLPDDELLVLDLAYPGSRPNRLSLISPEGARPLLKREILIVPGPDRVLLHIAPGQAGSIVIGGTACARP